MTKNSKTILLSHQIKRILDMFFNIFMAAYFLKITDGNLRLVSGFNLLYYICCMILFFLYSFTLKNKNITKAYRIGILSQVSIIVVLMIMKTSVIKYFYILAILKGLSTALYWLPYHILVYDANKEEDRKKYFSIEHIVHSIVGVVLPVSIGLILSYSSYNILFVTLLAISAVGFVYTLKIEKHINERKVNYKKFINKIKQHGSKSMMSIYISYIFSGMTQTGALNKLIVVATFMIFKNEFGLGVVKSILAVVSITVSYIVGKYIHEKYYGINIFISGFLLFILTLNLGLNFTKLNFLLYNIALYSAIPIIHILDCTVGMNILKDINIEKYRIEHISFREVFLSTGRVISYAIVIFAVFNDYTLSSITNLIVMFTFAILLRAIYLSKATKEKKVLSYSK